MSRFTKKEIDDALQNYQDLARQSWESGDWTIFPNVFTEDGVYIENSFGAFRGRKAIADFLVRCQAPFPHDMVFPLGWKVFDYEEGWLVMEVANRLIIPEKPGLYFDLINWTRLDYGGDGLWKRQEDLYNPLKMREVFDQWVAAGGKPLTTLMPMAHGEQ